MRILRVTKLMEEFLNEPRIVEGGLGAEDTVSTQTAEFYQDSSEAESAVAMERERAFNANGDLVRQELWQVSNAPVISAIATDGADPDIIDNGAEVELTIDGTNLGKNADDVRVRLICPAVSKATGQPITGSYKYITARVDAAADPAETQLTATLKLNLATDQRLVDGICWIEVEHVKRQMVSDRFEMELKLKR